MISSIKMYKVQKNMYYFPCPERFSLKSFRVETCCSKGCIYVFGNLV